tara:strand:- start:1840 stop:2130 length:291 start_codon:yes stop_codon:yes gene_type:complete
MFDVSVSINAGEAEVITSHGRGHSVEALAQLAVNKIMSVSENAPQPIRDQAQVFKKDLETVIVYYMQMAVTEEKATIAGKLREAGYPELAKNLRSL